MRVDIFESRVAIVEHRKAITEYLVCNHRVVGMRYLSLVFAIAESMLSDCLLHIQQSLTPCLAITI